MRRKIVDGTFRKHICSSEYSFSLLSFMSNCDHAAVFCLSDLVYNYRRSLGGNDWRSVINAETEDILIVVVRINCKL